MKLYIISLDGVIDSRVYTTIKDASENSGIPYRYALSSIRSYGRCRWINSSQQVCSIVECGIKRSSKGGLDNFRGGNNKRPFNDSF